MYTYRGVNACWCWHSINQSWAVLHFLERKGFWKKNQLERKSSQEKIISKEIHLKRNSSQKKGFWKENLLKKIFLKENPLKKIFMKENLRKKMLKIQNLLERKIAWKKFSSKKIFSKENLLERKAGDILSSLLWWPLSTSTAYYFFPVVR